MKNKCLSYDKYILKIIHFVGDDIHADIFKGQYKNNDGRSPINLEELNLSYNKIHSLRMDVFEHLPKLSVLNLAGNDFKVIDIHTAGSIASIKLLSVS